MSGRGVAASAAIHLALVIAMVAAGAAATPPHTTVDVEIVAPQVVVAEPPKPDPGPGSAPDRAGIAAAEPPRPEPPRRAEVVRKLPRAHRPAPRPPGDNLVPERAPEPAPPLAAAPLAPAEGDAPPQGQGAGVFGAGTGGGGTGGGQGDGIGDIDRSAPPVPIDASAAATLPYTEAAMRDRVSGDVSLVLAVDAIGRVGQATVRRGLGHGLDEIAAGMALRIRFRPARDREGRPVAGTVRWRFHFEPP